MCPNLAFVAEIKDYYHRIMKPLFSRKLPLAGGDCTKGFRSGCTLNSFIFIVVTAGVFRTLNHVDRYHLFRNYTTRLLLSEHIDCHIDGYSSIDTNEPVHCRFWKRLIILQHVTGHASRGWHMTSFKFRVSTAL